MVRHSTRSVRTTPLLGGVLVGSALAAGVLSPWSMVVADATPSDPACVAVTQRQHDLDQAKAAYTQQKAVAAAAQAKYQRLQADPKATDAAIEAARLDSVEAGQLSYKLYSAQNSASLALNEAVGAAKGHDCQGDSADGGGEGKGGDGGKTGGGGGGDKGGPGHGGPGHGRPGHDGPGHGRPGHGWGHPGPTPPRPVSGPVSIQSSSSATASTGPVIVSPAASTSSSGDSSSWTTGWFDGWFGDDTESSSGVAPAAGTGEVGGEVEASLVPAGSVSAGDGSGGLDAGHIGMAVAGLGALGLTSAGTAALVGRRHRQQQRP